MSEDHGSRRVADEWLREYLSQRLAGIEKSQNLYHGELKSIMETMHGDMEGLRKRTDAVYYTIYGGPEIDHIGLLERFRTLLRKVSLFTIVAAAVVSFVAKPLGVLLQNYVVEHFGKEEPVKTKRRR